MWQKIVDMPYITPKNVWFVIGGAVVISSLLIAGGSFWWYKRYQQQQASYAFVGALEDSERATRTELPSKETISELEQAFFAGAQRYASTNLAPFFEAFASEMQLRKGDATQALGTLQHALQDMTSSSPYYYLYATKIALMQLDSADEVVRTAGRKTLQELADNSKNSYRDMARYYLGLHEWTSGNRLAAKDIWSALDTKAEKLSVWTRLVEDKLALLAQ
jgi:hypothetical protein